MSDIKRSKTRVNGFTNDEMDFQLIRQMGSSSYMGASVGECLSLVNTIKDEDPGSWVAEFKKLAERQESDARKRAHKGHPISARDQFLKATNSYRAAEYYTSVLNPEHRQLGLKARECFGEAMQSLWHTFEDTMLDYKDIELPVYFMSPGPDVSDRKTLMIVSGFDGTLEEEYLMRGFPALERGYNVVLFAGPGQMDTFRFYSNVRFEPDFENPTKIVLEYISEKTEVDSNRIALMGISFGGYFATRAAAHLPEIKALIANSPILRLHDYLAAFTGYDPAEAPSDMNFTIEDIPEIPDSEFPPAMKLTTENLIARFGEKSFKDTYVYLREFDVGKAVENISCPCLALAGEGEGGEPDKQFVEFAEKVSGPVTKYMFTQSEGADMHCQLGNAPYSAAVAMDWLDEIFD